MEQVLCACDGVAAARPIDASAAMVAINLIGLIVLNITILLFPSICLTFLPQVRQGDTFTWGHFMANNFYLNSIPAPLTLLIMQTSASTDFLRLHRLGR